MAGSATMTPPVLLAAVGLAAIELAPGAVVPDLAPSPDDREHHAMHLPAMLGPSDVANGWVRDAGWLLSPVQAGDGARVAVMFEGVEASHVTVEARLVGARTGAAGDWTPLSPTFDFGAQLNRPSFLRE